MTFNENSIGFHFHFHWILLSFPLDFTFISIGNHFHFHWISFSFPLDFSETSIGNRGQSGLGGRAKRLTLAAKRGCMWRCLGLIYGARRRELRHDCYAPDEWANGALPFAWPFYAWPFDERGEVCSNALAWESLIAGVSSRRGLCRASPSSGYLWRGISYPIKWFCREAAGFNNAFFTELC